jgi:hypothetical protein
MGTKVNSNYEDLLTFTRASKGHALRPVSYGDELVENGTFDSDTSDWVSIRSSVLSSESERLRITNNGTSNGGAVTSFSTSAGNIYEVYVTGYHGTAGGAKFRLGTTSAGTDITTDITQADGETTRFIFVAPASVAYITLYASSGTTTGVYSEYDNVSVKEVLFDQPDGTLTLFEHPENVSRVEYDADGVRLGLLVEEQRTNLLTYSEDFTQSFYIKDSNVAVTSSNNTAPSGISNASLITVSDNGRIYANNTSITGVVSVFLKAGTFTNLKIKANNVDLVAKTASAGTLTEVGGGWFRYTSEEATAARHFQIQAYPDDTYSTHTQTGTYYIWGAQLEAGSFPTSYIKNEGTSSGVTRSADVASIPVADFGYNQSAGTVVVTSSIISPQTSQYNAFVQLVEDTNNRIDLGVLVNDGWQSIRTGGVDTAKYYTDGHNANIFDAGEVAITALAFSPTSTNSSANGSLGTEDTSSALPTAIQTLKIGVDHTSRYANGHIKSIKYYPRRLTNAQLQELTS